MLEMDAKDIEILKERKKEEKEAFKRQVMEMRALGMKTPDIAFQFGISPEAMATRISRMGLQDKRLSGLRKEVALRVGPSTGFSGGHHKYKVGEPKFAGPVGLQCVHPGCRESGHGRRQMCSKHRWEAIDREMIEVRRYEARETPRIEPWQRNFDMTSDGENGW